MIGDLGAADATALAGLVAAGEVTPTELLDAALAAVEARNPALNAVVLMQEGVRILSYEVDASYDDQQTPVTLFPAP